jgi:hypothetical protein
LAEMVFKLGGNFANPVFQSFAGDHRLLPELLVAAALRRGCIACPQMRLR